MTALEVAEILQDLGGYGVAGLMWWFWKQEKEERTRYRDNFEQTLRDLPKLTETLEDLREAVDKRNQESIQPPSHKA